MNVAAAARPARTLVAAALVAGAIVLTAIVLAAMGHPVICTCGVVRLWVSDANGPENSQQIADWYTWTHLIHGLLFYGGLWLLARRVPLPWRLVIATLIECAWEILENSPAIIDRYRTGTISVTYFGDSILNSVSDVVAMLAGFWLASRLPTWASVVLAVAIEIVLALVMRDNLTLNVLMLLWPLDAVRQWQAGGLGHL